MKPTDSKTTAASSKWEDDVEIPREMTLGEVIDGFARLSSEDKRRFCAVWSLGPRTAAAAVAGSTPAPNPRVDSTDSSTSSSAPTKGASSTSEDKKTTGSSLGSSKDPKTGKVYRILPKVERSKEFLGLENISAKAKIALDAYKKRNGLTLDFKTKVTTDKTGKVFNTPEYSTLVASVKAANAAVGAYKISHPDEFVPPPTKGKGRKDQSPPSDDDESKTP